MLLKCSRWCGEVTLTHEEPWRFCSSKWMVIQCFLVYRFILAFYPIGWIVYGILVLNDKLKWAIFMTNWLTVLLFMYFQIMFWLSLYRFRASKTVTLVRSHLFFVEQYAWACFNVIVALGPTVLLIFGIYIYPQNGFGIPLETAQDFFISPLLIIVEIFVSSMPLRLAHIYFPIVWGFAYIMFAVGYEIGGLTSTDGGNYVYPDLNFQRDPAKAVGFAFVSEFALAGFFIVSCGIVWCRENICQAFCSSVNRHKYLIID